MTAPQVGDDMKTEVQQLRESTNQQSAQNTPGGRVPSAYLSHMLSGFVADFVICER